MSNDPLLVAVADEDVRFCGNPLVTGALHLRFYAGVPLRSVEGYAMGTLCISDALPRNLSATELAQLCDFAALAERELTSVQLSEALLHQQAIEDELRLSEARFAAVIATLSEGVVVQDTSGMIHSHNASAERILGLSSDQLLGRTSIDPRWHAIREDGSPFPGEEHPAMQTLRTGQPHKGVVMGLHMPDGQVTWIVINCHPLHYPDDPTPQGVACSFVDITQYKSYTQQLEGHNAALTVLATTDGLTGIMNKRAFLEHLEAEAALAHERQLPLALLLLDVDEFKPYNDSFGHPSGDLVLRQVAQLLVTMARATDLVARYGSEEFAMILPNTDLEGAMHLANRCRVALVAANFPHREVTASFGVALLEPTVGTGQALLAQADQALYAAKHAGRNTVVCASDPRLA
ncbi:MAG: diguanylate cyclase [Oscillochloridaceae bacterium umkhey_bin13]